MTSPQRPTGLPDCKYCLGEGYVLEPYGPVAQARICTCVPPCEFCGGIGRRLVEREGVQRMARCRCQMLPDRLKLLNQADLPARHAQSSFASFSRDVPGAAYNYDFAWGWVDRFEARRENRGLVLSGAPGRGKTHLLVAILRELIMRHGVAARFVEFSHLLSELKAGFDDGVGESTTLMPLVRVPVLAIDELGKGRGTEWELTIVDALISHRYNGLATTLATTNYRLGASTGMGDLNLSSFTEKTPRRGDDPASGRGVPTPTLGDRVGDRVFSRLKEMCTMVPVLGDDFRARLT